MLSIFLGGRGPVRIQQILSSASISAIRQQELLLKILHRQLSVSNSYRRAFVSIRISSFVLPQEHETGTQIHQNRSRNYIPKQRRHNGSLKIPNNLLQCQFGGRDIPFGSRCQHSASEGPFLPPLMVMPFPPRTWPRFFNTIRNWFFTYFVIRPYMDKDFDIHEFNRGAKQAVCFVSEKLVRGEYDDLEGLVEPTALTQIKHSLATFTQFQKDLLRVTVDDIFFSYPYQIGIMIPDPVRQDGDKILPQTRHVEITVVFHVLRGFAEKSKSGGDSQTFQDFIKSEDTKYNVMICNYRFFKDFTEGAKSPTWIINIVNHFLPADKSNYNQEK